VNRNFTCLFTCLYTSYFWSWNTSWGFFRQNKNSSLECVRARKCNRCWRKLCSGQNYNLYFSPDITGAVKSRMNWLSK